jgi:serine/threonine protein phosphatase PrpC
MKSGQEKISSSRTKDNQNQDQKTLIKSKTLHELLKQGGGQNLIIDFSMLSKKGTLNGLIEKAKKYQNTNNQKIIEEPYDKKKENEEKNYKNSKKFEILTKFSQRRSKNIESDTHIRHKEIDDNNKNNNNNINNEKELINDLSNKINITTTDADNMDETDNTYQGCLELEYDNSQSDFYSSREASKPNKNYSYIENDLNRKDKKVKFNDNNTSNYYLPNNHRYQDKELDPEPEQDQEQQILTKSFNYAYNLPKEIPEKKKPKNYVRRPFVIENKTNKNSNFKENTKFMKKSYNKIIKTNQNQAIEYETIKENYSIKHCNCVLEYSFREDQNIDSEILMEDKSKSIENFNNDKNQMVFEIFDGHGGDEMSVYLQNNLAQIYKQNLLLNKGNIILSLKNAFHDADDEMRNQLNIEGLGSTGTLVHIKWESENDLVVYSANVGDSRVSLISPEHIIRLSYDHRTSDEKERKRILESGLEIIDDRINGTLMLTRIFGNYEYKNNIENEEDEENSNSNNNNSNKGLICEPFISKINIDLNIENQFLILASDGIWDTITEEEIQNIIQYHNDTQQICSIAIKNCLRNEAWDNLSIFAIKLT